VARRDAPRRDGEVLVRFRVSASQQQRNEAARGVGGRRAGLLRGGSRIERVTLSAGQEPEVAAAALRHHLAVELAEPNYLIRGTQIVPDDPRFAEQWALRNAGQTGGAPGTDIGAAEAWETTTGSPSTVVAVIDSGIDFSHPDLQHNRWTNPAERGDGRDEDGNGLSDDLHGWNFVSDNGEVGDEHGHGTGVAGLIAAEGNNRVGTAGVMWRAGLMSLRVLDHSGTGHVAAAVEAIDYALAHGASVINCSWGLEAESLALREALERAGRRGAVVVVAAGNGGLDLDQSPYYPTSYGLRNLISVAASDGFDNPAPWSNRGRQVAVAAPGVDLLTTGLGGRYTTVSGTSAAAALVSGVVGLIKTARPHLSAGGTLAAITGSVRRVAALEGRVAAGGVAHVAAALRGPRQTQPVPGPEHSADDAPGTNGVGSESGLGNQEERQGKRQEGKQEERQNLTLPAPGRGVGGTGPGGGFAVEPPSPPAGTFGANLPNPDAARALRPAQPRIAPAVPSKHPYCWPADPACRRRPGAEQPKPPQPAPTPPPRASVAGILAATTPAQVAAAGAREQGEPPLWLDAYLGRGLRSRSGLITAGLRSVSDAPEGERLALAVARPVAGSDYGAEQSVSVSAGAASLSAGGAAFGWLSADCSSVQGSTGESWVNVYVYVDGVNVGTTQAGDFGDFSFDISTHVNDGAYHNLSAWYFSWHWGWTQAGASAVSGCLGPLTQFSPPRLEPRNRTGQPGVDNGSRNINWSVPLVSLPGRAGLDLNLSLTYNSLVWTKSSGGDSIMFDADHGYPSPGFRLGLPLLQPRFYNAEAGVYSYMLVTPAGGRIELRQVGGSNTYEAADGSYTQMSDYGTGWAVVRTGDGTVLSFGPLAAGEMRCTQIKDRNGNFISLYYDGAGKLAQITDTLGRALLFHYDGNNRLNSITQQRGASTYYWATFVYGDVQMQPNFPGLAVHGPQNTTVSLLTGVNLPDGSGHRFEYTPFGQVGVVRRLAPDGHQRASTAYNLGTGPHADCPRFSEERRWVEMGVMDQNAEVLTTYSAAADGSSTEVTLPDGTMMKEFFYTDGWRRGLTSRTEVWAGNALRKWTTTAWTQDDEGVTYKVNPRPIEINVHDAEGNRRRTTIDYHAAFSLPSGVREWGGPGGDQLLRLTTTGYNLDAAYISRRIIGLVASRHVYDGTTGALVSKVAYEYDEATAHLQYHGEATQHDSGNYGAGFAAGRGNLSVTYRFDAENPQDWSRVQVWHTGYNTQGSVVFTQDPLAYRATVGYADSFADGVGRDTLAYPTTTTDPEGFASTRKYDYHTGALTRATDPKGAAISMEYDAAGRPSRTTNVVSGAYARYGYSADANHVVTLRTARWAHEEIFSAAYLDGVGRVRAVQDEMPDSVGGFAAVYFLYDAMGRRVWQSNPTEINALWAPAGDDAAAGWKWTRQSYDWQGRPTLTVLPDGQTREATYGGCGCAGGEVVTLRDERGRRRRLTRDALGRLAKTEELNWDTNVYSTALYAYNARDQLTQINHAGQARLFEYDGYGRLRSRTTPEQGLTTYTYMPNDWTQSVTDARGASQHYAYNGRGLVTAINFGVPAGVAATPNVTFGYDAAGNRTGMTDGYGSVSYQYDTLSRMTQETRHFNGVGSFPISYQYDAADQLISVTNPWGVSVGYTRDRAGRVSAVTGAGYAGVSTYASGLQYRASGALKHLLYGNGLRLGLDYDSRLRMSRWNVTRPDNVSVLGSAYSYHHFGEQSLRVTFAESLTGGNGSTLAADRTLDRSYDYDHVGRLSVSTTGSNARHHVGWGGTPTHDGPYSQLYVYDLWGNLTQRVGWGGENPSYAATFSGNRMQYNTANGWTMQHDAAGNQTFDGGQHYSYDATGQQAFASLYTTEQGYDGDRLRVRRSENWAATYYVRSSVLGGQVVAEVTSGGGWQRGYVYLGSQLLALQAGGVEWAHQDPVTKSQRLTNVNGAVTVIVEADPWGGESWGWSSNSWWQPRRYTSYTRDGNGSDEAMMRRYNRLWAKFEQPDPYDGSYDLSDPQSFNRYAYAQNDPINFIDPLGLCVFNISITNNAGVSDAALRSMRSEIRRIFREAGHAVVFNMPRFPGINTNRSYGITIQSGGNSPGWTSAGATFVNNSGFASTDRLRETINSDRDQVQRALGMIDVNFGRALGRVAAHESMHYFLQLFNRDHTPAGLMQAGFGGREWFSTANNADFLLSAAQANSLSLRCPPVTTTDSPLGTQLHSVGGGGGGGGSGYVGGGGYPSWWYSMWAFVEWVNSIPVSRREEVTVTIID
jgi:RHS repeat-associated protein